jgi:hypothetical protein
MLADGARFILKDADREEKDKETRGHGDKGID